MFYLLCFCLPYSSCLSNILLFFMPVKYSSICPLEFSPLSLISLYLSTLCSSSYFCSISLLCRIIMVCYYLSYVNWYQSKNPIITCCQTLFKKKMLIPPKCRKSRPQHHFLYSLSSPLRLHHHINRNRGFQPEFWQSLCLVLPDSLVLLCKNLLAIKLLEVTKLPGIFWLYSQRKKKCRSTSTESQLLTAT